MNAPVGLLSGALPAAGDPRRRRPGTQKMLVVDRATAEVRDTRIDEIAGLLGAGDLLVLNDAATLPASLHATDPSDVEVRLLAHVDGPCFRAVLFGAADFRTDTDARRAPPVLPRGTWIRFGERLAARVERGHALSPRLVELHFDREGAELHEALYRIGRPVQYSYVKQPLRIEELQSPAAQRPWAVEMPSAARPLTWRLLLELRRRGVVLAAVTHAAGLSATGDPALDRALPLPERYEIPEATADAVRRARKAGGRVVAVGTTVVRALEGAFAARGELVPGSGVTDLRIDERHRLRVADALLTNMHAPGESHFDLLRAFAPDALLRVAHARAVEAGYLAHELGDATLIV